MQKTRKRRLQVAVIGKGRLGTSLALALQKKTKQFQLFAHLPARTSTRTLTPLRKNGGPDIIIIATRDKSLRKVSREVVPYAGKNLRIMAHTAGAFSPTIIFTRNKAALATFHPLQTFPKPDPELFKGIGFAISTADAKAASTLTMLAKELGAEDAIRIDAKSLPLYHAMAAYGANFLVVLGAVIEKIAKSLKIPEQKAKHLLRPIMTEALENILTHSSGEVLTGPIARGDSLTLNAHLKALSALDPAIARIYNDFLFLAKKYHIYGGAK